jgi:hypothetical protein
MRLTGGPTAGPTALEFAIHEPDASPDDRLLPNLRDVG